MIQQAISFTGAEKAIVDAFEARKKDDKKADYWKEAEVEPVKSEIKRHYLTQQGFRCCYCNQEYLISHGRFWDVEHVLARSTHPWFLFEPKNLAVSCIECNQSKSDTGVCTVEAKRKYPDRPDRFTIVHPHYDEYSDHIEIVMNRIYFSKTSKGSLTVYLCKLERFSGDHLGVNRKYAEMGEILQLASELLAANDDVTRKAKIDTILIAATQGYLRR